METAEAFMLSNNEVAAILQYRSLSEKEKRCIDLMLQTLAEK